MRLSNKEFEENEITFERSDIQQLKDEIYWELKEYEGNCEEHFAILHNTTIFKILQILNYRLAETDNISNTRQELDDYLNKP